MRNPFRVSNTQSVRMVIHKDLALAIKKEKAKQQRVANAKFGKNKFQVSMTYASKVLGGFLK